MEEEAAFTSSNASQSSESNDGQPEERDPENNLVQFLIAQSPQLMNQPFDQRFIINDEIL
jgi:hypothetical protein